MYRIRIAKQSYGAGLDTASFRDLAPKLYEKKRSEDGALIGAFVLYRREDAEVIDAMSNEAYWNALNDISGEFFCVFVLFTPLRPPSQREEWLDSDTLDAQSAWTELHSFLGVSTKIQLPSVVFFQVVEGTITNSTIASISAQSAESAFSSMKDLFVCARSALVDVEERYNENRQEIFYLVENALQHKFSLERIREIGKPLKQVIRIMGKLAGGNGIG